MNLLIRLSSLNAVRSLRPSLSPVAAVRTMTTCAGYVQQAYAGSSSEERVASSTLYLPGTLYVPNPLFPYSKPMMDPPRKSRGIVTVPEGTVYVIKRFGKIHRTLQTGNHVLIPLVDEVAFTYSLKEMEFYMPKFISFYLDDQWLHVNGSAHVKMFDPLCGFTRGYRDPFRFALLDARFFMRNEILSNSFQNIGELEQCVQNKTNERAAEYGVECTQCRIRVNGEEAVKPQTEEEIVKVFERRILTRPLADYRDNIKLDDFLIPKTRRSGSSWKTRLSESLRGPIVSMLSERFQ